MERYHAKLIVKEYAHKYGINFSEIFSPIVRLTKNRVVLVLCVTFYLHLEKLDVKMIFFM